MPRRAASVGLRGNPRESGKIDIAGARLLRPEQHAEQCGDAGAFKACKADDFSGPAVKSTSFSGPPLNPLTTIAASSRSGGSAAAVETRRSAARRSSPRSLQV